MSVGPSPANIPTRDELRAELAGFDETRKKVVGGMLALMFQSPEKAGPTGWRSSSPRSPCSPGSSRTPSTSQGWSPGLDPSNIDPVLNACFALFVLVAEDVQQEDAAAELTTADAMLRALAYFG